MVGANLPVKRLECNMDDVTITRHRSGSSGEYHAHVAGSRRIGRLSWVLRGTVRVAEHTLVPPEIGYRDWSSDVCSSDLRHMARDAGCRCNRCAL